MTTSQMKSYLTIVLLSYFFGGSSRGAILSTVTPQIIYLYSQCQGVTNFDATQPLIIAVIMTAPVVGSFIGSFLGSFLIKYCGRRITLLICGIAGLATSLISCIPWNWIYLAIIRFITGIGTSSIMPTMAILFSEFIPPKNRGLISTLNMYFASIGGVVEVVLQIFIYESPNYFWTMFLFPIIVCGGIIIMFFFIKEKNDSQSTEHGKSKTKVSKISVFQSKYKKCWIIALVLGIGSQGTGVMPITQYATITFQNLFQAAGQLSGAYGMLMICVIGMVAGAIALFFINKIKRKILMNVGTVGILLGLILFEIQAGGSLDQNSIMTITILGQIVFWLAQYISWSALVITLCGEVFPSDVKTVFVQNVVFASIYVTMIFEMFVFPLITIWIDYVIMIVLSIISIILLDIFLPETAGKKLEDIESQVIPVKRQALLKF